MLIIKLQVYIYFNFIQSTIYIYIYLLFYNKHNGMSSIKIIDASQAQNITRYKNLKKQILKCCANIYFNKILLCSD